MNDNFKNVTQKNGARKEKREEETKENSKRKTQSRRWNVWFGGNSYRTVRYGIPVIPKFAKELEEETQLLSDKSSVLTKT